MTSVYARRAVFFFACGAALLAAVNHAVAEQPADVPHPDASFFDSAVREAVEDARARLQTQETSADPRRHGQAWGRLGDLYASVQAAAAAAACYANAAALDTGTFRWHYLHGVFAEKTGQPARAAQAYRRALEIDAAYLPLLIRLARIEIVEGQLEQASGRIRHALQVAPGNVAALAELGEIAMAEDRYADSIQHFQAALKSQPSADWLHYRMALVYQKIGNADKARDHIKRRGTTKLTLTDSLFQAASDVRPQNARSFLEEGDAAVAKGYGASAMYAYEKALALDPEFVEALESIGTLLFSAGQRAQAVENFNKALKLDSNSAISHFYLGLIQEREAKHNAAKRHYRRALSYDPARYRLAGVLMRERHYSEAIEHLRHLASQAGNSGASWYWLGVAYLAENACRDAEKALRKAHGLNSEIAEVIEVLARIYSSCLAERDADRQWALQYAQLLYQKKPTPSYAETLAMAMAANGRFKEAQDYQSRAIIEEIKLDRKERLPALRSNLARYENKKHALLPWEPGASRLAPPDAAR